MIEQRERRKAWQEGFHSLYNNFRRGGCPHFFYKSVWCFALFLSGDSDTCAEKKRCNPTVIMTGVLKNYRDQLSSYGVAFSTPLNQHKQGESNSKEVEVDKMDEWQVSKNEDIDAVAECEALKDFHNVSVRLPHRETDAQAAALSVLQVKGRHAVHCLYDFMMNHTPRSHDVPIIISLKPFLNASCRSAKILSVTEGSMAGSGDKRYVLEIKGDIPPFSVLRLCHLLSRMQKDGFEIRMQGDEQC